MTGTNIELCRLYHTFEDSSSEYKLQKIKFDEPQFERLISIWSDDIGEKVTCVGFLGDQMQVSIACQHFLELTIEQTENLENLLKEQISIISECLIAYRKANKIAFIYCSNNVVFQEGPLLPTVLAIDYVRYIIDICEKILVLPPINIQCDATITNPFQDSANTYVQLQERSIRPNETISITQLNTNQKLELTNNILVQCSSSCRSYLQLCQDYSRHFVTYHFHRETDHIRKQVKVSNRDLLNTCYRSTEIFVDYETATNYLIKKWSVKHLFFANIQNRAMVTFKHFIQDNKQQEFEQFLADLSQRYETIIEAKSLDANKAFVNKLIQTCREHSCAAAGLADGFISNMVSKGKSLFGMGSSTPPAPTADSDFSKRHKKCSESCTTLDILLNNLKQHCSQVDQIPELINTLKKYGTPEIFIYLIHWLKVDDVKRHIKDQWRTHTQRDLLNVYDDHCQEARVLCAMELNQWLQSNTRDYDEIHRTEMKIS